jgi:DNA/RNA endonuclease G (NUC1)
MSANKSLNYVPLWLCKKRKKKKDLVRRLHLHPPSKSPKRKKKKKKKREFGLFFSPTTTFNSYTRAFEKMQKECDIVAKQIDSTEARTQDRKTSSEFGEAEQDSSVFFFFRLIFGEADRDLLAKPTQQVR